MIVEKYRPEHLSQLDLQRAQAGLSVHLIDWGYAKSLESPWSFTARDSSGGILGCGGAIEIWSGRAFVWTLIGANAGKNFKAIHKVVSGFLQAAPWRRVECTVDPVFEQGHRWVKMLGFEYEGTAKAYNPNGSDACIYSRVKNHG